MTMTIENFLALASGVVGATLLGIAAGYLASWKNPTRKD